MKRTPNRIKLLPLLESAFFTAQEGKKKGVPVRMLDYFCEQGVIERIGRGVYRSSEAQLDDEVQWEDLAITVQTIPEGVICLLSALCYYELTDEIMREYWIAVPNAQKAPKRKHTKIVRMRNMTLGLEKAQIGKWKVKIFNKERAVVDAFRYLDKETAICVLARYLQKTDTHRPNIRLLMQYARALRTSIEPYLLALNTVT